MVVFGDAINVLLWLLPIVCFNFFLMNHKQVIASVFYYLLIKLNDLIKN